MPLLVSTSTPRPDSTRPIAYVTAAFGLPGSVMALIRDTVPAFAFFQPTSIEDAQVLLRRYGPDAWVLAGGLDSLEWLKGRVRRPEALVDLGQIEALKGVHPVDGGVAIGAMSTIADLLAERLLVERYPLLVSAAEAAAGPHSGGQGTIGGNVSQDTRCSYYRAGVPCFRAGGDACPADTPEGLNREHAILHADRCVAVNGSDVAPALIALDATMIIRTADGTERRVAAEDYFVGPAADITRMTILGAGDLLTAIHLPASGAAPPLAFGVPRVRHYFEKVRDSLAWDVALVTVASSMTLSGTTIERIRIAVNGVAARPLRLHAVEAAVLGQKVDDAVAAAAAGLAVEGARPLAQNAFKVALLRNVVRRAVLAAI